MKPSLYIITLHGATGVYSSAPLNAAQFLNAVSLIAGKGLNYSIKEIR